jgi:phospholipid/cholesterol/gamma-HCH transport system substrate-binding protein
MVTRVPRRGAIAVAVAFALSCVLLIIYVWTQFGGTLPLAPKGYRFHADFAQASQLTPNADVRIAGVNVGKVVDVTPHGVRADATIQLQANYAPLPADARAILRQKTLLGETFVALSPGTKAAPKLPDGGRLNDAQVQDTQQLDTVLGSFDAPTQRNLRRFFDGFANALDARGADLNEALGNLDPAVSSLNRVVSILDLQRPSVQRLVHDTGTVLATIGERRADLTTLVDAGNQVFSATASRDRQLTDSVRLLPAFLGQLRLTLAAVDRTAGYAAPTLAALRPVGPLVAPALQQLITLSPAVTALLREIGPVITTSIRSLPAATSVVDATVPFVDQLLAATSQVMPVTQLTSLYGTAIASAFANQAAAYQATTTLPDGTLAHYLRTELSTTNESTVGATQRPGSNRHNPYPAPGILDELANGGLPASDCRNTANPSPPPANPPPCHLQAPLNFGGAVSYYPQVKAQPHP